MDKELSFSVWSDYIDVEDDMAWFVESETNVLFSMDLKTSRCKFIQCLPGFGKDFRINPLCLKCGDVIFCFPDKGEFIWIYDLVNESLNKIVIDNSEKVRIGICNVFQYGDTIFAVANGLRKVIEINIKDKAINQYYTLSMDPEEKIAESIDVERCIFCVSPTLNGVYEFNMDTKEIKFYKIPKIEDKINTICYDGEKFWFSGCSKILYVWDKELNIVDAIENFPNEFGIYDLGERDMNKANYKAKNSKTPLFIKSIGIKEYIWFIPYRTNKILYVDKRSYEINSFEIDNEEENEQSWRRGMNIKYIVEYILNERYIGLYSFKNRVNFEVDTEKLLVMPKNFIIGYDTIKHIHKVFFQQDNVLLERRNGDLLCFIECCKTNQKECEKKERFLGKGIFDALHTRGRSGGKK